MVVVMITTTTVAVIFRNVIVNLLIYHLFSTDRFIVVIISLNILMIIVLIVTVLIAVIVCISITSILVMSGADGAEGCGDPAGALQCLGTTPLSPSFSTFLSLSLSLSVLLFLHIPGRRGRPCREMSAKWISLRHRGARRLGAGFMGSLQSGLRVADSGSQA